MAIYRVKDPSLTKLNELSILSFNVRFWTIEFRGLSGKPGKLGMENHKKMCEAEAKLDEWIKKNIETIDVTENEQI